MYAYEMVREGHDHGGGVTLSSIALLQERFRQLQKMRELRQEKQLLMRMLSESERSSSYSTPTSKPSSPASYGDALLSHHHPQYCQLSLSLWPDSENKNAGSTATEAAARKSSFGSDRACTSTAVKHQSCDSEIDTSLRL